MFKIYNLNQHPVSGMTELDMEWNIIGSSSIISNKKLFTKRIHAVWKARHNMEWYLMTNVDQYLNACKRIRENMNRDFRGEIRTNYEKCDRYRHYIYDEETPFIKKLDGFLRLYPQFKSVLPPKKHVRYELLESFLEEMKKVTKYFAEDFRARTGEPLEKFSQKHHAKVS